MQTSTALQQLNLDQRFADARQGLEKLNRDALSFIKARPGACLLGAVIVGFIVGRIAARA